MAGSKEGGMDGGDVVIKACLRLFEMIVCTMECLLRPESILSSGLIEAMID